MLTKLVAAAECSKTSIFVVQIKHLLFNIILNIQLGIFNKEVKKRSENSERFFIFFCKKHNPLLKALILNFSVLN
jgi:hypothetical protein